MVKRAILFLSVLFVATAAFGADRFCVVSGRGHFRIHVGSAGLFGAFAHDHVIEARKVEGCATIDPKDKTHSSIKLDFATADLKVVDPQESEENRAKVQKTMEAEVLHVSEYPRVTFESTAIEGASALNRRLVRGNLTIRGKTQRISIPLMVTQLTDGTYRAAGEYKFKQTAFGIAPIQLARGTIKVKDELRTEFELFLK